MQAMLRAVLSAFFVLYFSIWLSGGLGLTWPEKIVPEALLFFTRSAALFPHAATHEVDYYAEGWDCQQERWVEIDPRPYFPIIISGRENRFDRIVHLFRYNQQVLEELRAFLVTHHNADHPQQPIADVRLLSVRVPLPPWGGEVKPYERRPLSATPPKQHKLWSHYTPPPERAQRCQAALSGQSFDLHDPVRERPGRPGRKTPKAEPPAPPGPAPQGDDAKGTGSDPGGEP
jgi:hypothetical protein